MMEEAGFVLRLMLGLIFATSASGKAANLKALSETVNEVQTMAGFRWRRGASSAAITVVALEAALAIALFVGVSPVAVAVVAIALLAVFAAIAAVAAIKGAEIDCRCFGVAGARLGIRTSVRAALLAISAAAYLAASLVSGAAPWIPHSVEDWVSAVTAGLGAALLFAWFTSVDVPNRPVARPSLSTSSETRSNKFIAKGEADV